MNDLDPIPGQGLSMAGTASPFGAEAGWVEAQPARFASRDGAELAGLHFYLGSNLTDEGAVAGQLLAAIRIARRLCDVLDLDPAVVDVGGGFGAPFARSGSLPRLDGLAGRLGGPLDDAFPCWRQGQPVVAFESGRYLTGTSGTLLTRVVDVKTSYGRPVVVLESGINHLGGMSGLRRLPPMVPDLFRGGRTGAELVNAVVAGPLCTPLDTWAPSATLPALEPGDVVSVPNVGAYGLYASLLGFLAHPAPREVVVDRGAIVDVSQLELVRKNRRMV